MRRLVAALILVLLSAPARADTCPVKHPALTALDHASMLAAYTASFRGLFNRNPTLAAGSGADDGNYWVAVSDHYGEFGDTVCRAGWSAYWEVKLTGQDAVNPALGDQPARFQPTSTPPSVDPLPPPPTPPPASPPLPTVVTCDTAAIVAQLGVLTQKVDAVASDVASARADVRTIGDSLKSVVAFASKYVLPEVATWIVGHQMSK